MEGDNDTRGGERRSIRRTCRAAARRRLAAGYAAAHVAGGVAAIGFGLGWAPVLVASAPAVLTTVAVSGAARQRERADRAERRLEALLRGSSEVVAVVDAEGIVSYVSGGLSELLGFEPDELLGRPLAALAHPDDLERARALGEADASVQARLHHKDGGLRWCDVHVSDLRDDPLVGGIVLNVHDVTERRLLEEQLRHQSLHDDVTGLANRRLFVDRLERGVVRQWRTGQPMAVLLVDLDDFKIVNDTFGHEAGDAVLAQLARRFVGCVRATDTVARLGDDEFAVVLEECTDRAEVDQVCDRILGSLAGEIDVQGRRLSVTGSIGAVMAEPWLASAPELLRHADLAAYAAKARGERRVAWYESGMDSLVGR